MVRRTQAPHTFNNAREANKGLGRKMWAFVSSAWNLISWFTWETIEPPQTMSGTSECSWSFDSDVKYCSRRRNCIFWSGGVAKHMETRCNGFLIWALKLHGKRRERLVWPSERLGKRSIRESAEITLAKVPR